MGLIERITKPDEIVHKEDGFPVNYLYTAGIAGEKFFRNLKDGKIIGSRCKKCSYTYVPPKMYCERCFEKLTEFIDIKGRGKLYSYTIVYKDNEGRALQNPIAIGAVKLDGADTVLIHRISEIDYTNLKIGMDVEVVFKDSSARKGSITDIAYFKPY